MPVKITEIEQKEGEIAGAEISARALESCPHAQLGLEPELFPSCLTKPVSALLTPPRVKRRPRVRKSQDKGRTPPVMYLPGLCCMGPRVGLAEKRLLTLSVPMASICPGPLLMLFTPPVLLKVAKVCSKPCYHYSTTCENSSVQQFTPNSTGACKAQGKGRRTDTLTPLF